MISNTLHFLCTWQRNTVCGTSHIEGSSKYSMSPIYITGRNDNGFL